MNYELLIPITTINYELPTTYYHLPKLPTTIYHLTMQLLKLIDLAAARSGDKNDVCNIGVLAKTPDAYQILKKHLSAEVVKNHFGSLITGEVVRYEWDSIEALNFVCHGALDGGASRSMRMDTLGKNFSSHLLRLELTIPN